LPEQQQFIWNNVNSQAVTPQGSTSGENTQKQQITNKGITDGRSPLYNTSKIQGQFRMTPAASLPRLNDDPT